MTIETLKRVMWRVRKSNPGKDRVRNHELELAIMKEIGVHPATYRLNRKALVKLGWIRAINNKWVRLTNDDLTES